MATVACRSSDCGALLLTVCSGLAISRAAAAAGANVAIFYHSNPEAEKNAAEVAKDFGVKVKAYKCDVSDMQLVKQTVQQAEKDLGQVTALAANAGVSVVKPALELTPDDFHKVFNVNVLGVFNTAQAVASHWVETGFKKGAIVVTSSMSPEIYNQSDLCEPLTQIFYNSSKGAVTNMVKGLAAEFAQYGIRVNALEPGFCDTEQTSHMDAKIRDYQASTVPLKRFSEPKEQGEPAVFLLSELAHYITGTYVSELCASSMLTFAVTCALTAASRSTKQSSVSGNSSECLVESTVQR